MTIFLFVAALLIAIAGALLLPPLLRGREGQPRATVAAVMAGVVLIGGSAAAYHSLSHWPWAHPPVVEDQRAMISQLARRLEREPDDLEGWLMLGRSYSVIGQTQLAARAYVKADQLAGGKNVEALLGIAEARVADNDAALTGKAGEMIERALALDPTSAKALFYGAAAAERRGDWPLARQRFLAMLALDPPENVRAVIEQQVQTLDAKLAARAGGASPTASESAGSGSKPATDILVRISISVTPALANAITPDAPLFVIARDPEHPGPPLAVKRVESRFPQSVELGADDAMLAGRALAPGQKVQLVARVARGGTPQARTGDPFGETTFDVGSGPNASILIDRLTP